MHHSTNRSRGRRGVRRGFNLVEMLVALTISATLLTATLVALDASFMAYQRTTEVASTHTVGRLALYRMLALVRTGSEFGPFPLNPLDTIVDSDEIQFRTPDGDVMTLKWVDSDPGYPEDNALYVETGGNTYLLLEGVIPQFDPDTGDQIMPFTLEYEKGRILYRATIDLSIVPDDNMSTTIDGANADVIRFVASAMPRSSAYE